MECVGKGTIRLHDLDEDYIITFPKAYGRSILTTPWFEMGGHCKIICSKTGYSAKVTFHEKPLIGGYKHKITAEIKAPDETKPILLVEGLWNDKMLVIGSDRESRKKKRKEAQAGAEDASNTFVDTKTMGVVKKQTDPLTAQGDFESRRLWREVTWCLKNKETESATYYKTALEEKQREGMKPAEA